MRIHTEVIFMRLDAVQGFSNTISTPQAAQAQPIPEVQPDPSYQASVQEGQDLIREVERPEHQGAKGNGQDNRTEQEVEAENEKIRKALSDLNKKLDNHSEVVFGIHDKTNRVTIKMVDKDSKKVIKEFPPDKTLDMIAKVWEIAGIMVDEKG